MCIAISDVAMRISEMITIYLATGAPFSISYALSFHSDISKLVITFRAIAIGLLWPVATARFLATRYARWKSVAKRKASTRQHDQRINESKRHLLADLHEFSELVTRRDDGIRTQLERAACVLNESVGTYVGLADIVTLSTVDAKPRKADLELFRIAGVTGDELVLAATCVQRRNALKLIEHHSRARNQMIHALADIYECINAIEPSHIEIDPDCIEFRTLSRRLVERTENLFQLLGDEGAAEKVKALLDRDRFPANRDAQSEAQIHLAETAGGESCTAQTARPCLVPSSREITIARG